MSSVLVVVQVALKEELGLLAPLVQDLDKVTVLKSTKDPFVYAISISGVGKIAGALGVATTMASLHAAGITQQVQEIVYVSLGTCGAIPGSNLEVNDVVVPELTYAHDYCHGSLKNPILASPGTVPGTEPFEMYKSAFEELTGRTLASGDRLVDSEDYVEILRAQGASIVEMEAAGVAEACSRLGLKFLPIKAVSDYACSGTPSQYIRNRHGASCAATMTLYSVFGEPYSIDSGDSIKTRH